MGFNVVIGGFFTSIERPTESFLISLSRGLVSVVVALFTLTALFGGEGIWWAGMLSELLTLILTVLLYKRYSKVNNKQSLL